jgi:HEAT repeat protein
MFDHVKLQWNICRLNSAQWKNRKKAAERLGKLNHSAAIQLLMERISDPEIEVREAITKAVISIGGSEAGSVNSILKKLETQTPEWKRYEKVQKFTNYCQNR